MLTLSLLGTPVFELDNQPLSRLITGRMAALLSYLAVTRTAQPRTQLADLLWEDVSEQQSRANLRYLLSNLRKIVGDYVVATSETIAFNQSMPHWLDLTTFTTYMTVDAPSSTASAEPLILQELLNLYRGEFLAGFQLESGTTFERWMLAQRRYLHDLFVHGLQLRTQQHLTQGEYAAGLALNHYLLKLEPWREEAHRQRMLLFAYSGQRSAALQQYTCCCQALAQELDILPMPETTSLYEQIKSGQWFTAQQAALDQAPLPVIITPFPTGAPTPQQMPANGANSAVTKQAQQAMLLYDLGAMPATDHFYGRQAELATLHSWSGQEHSRLIALLGGCGQGKTALAAAFVQDIMEDEHSPAHGFTQVIWRSLQDAPSCLAILQGWLQQLDEEHAATSALSFDELSARLFALLQARRCLLVLDGIEAILAPPTRGEAKRCARYRPGCEAYSTLFRLFFQRRHQSCLLLTSRIRPEVLTYLDERNGAFHTLELAGLSTEDGAALLAAHRIAGDAMVYRQLHHHYAGNPHWLSQAANLIYELFDGDVTAFLREGFYFLGDIGATLAQQLTQCSSLELQVLQRLAQADQALCRELLWQQLTPLPTKPAYFQALQTLQRAFLLQQTTAQLELPALLTAYLAEHPLVAEPLFEK